MNLIGLEFIKHQEQKRHNQATEADSDADRSSRETIAFHDRKSRESIADKDRTSKENIASLDRDSRERVSSLDRQSRENIASADRQSRVEIADADRQQRETESKRSADTSRYTADMRFLGNAKNPIVNTALSFAIMTDRFGSGNWSSKEDKSGFANFIQSTVDPYQDLAQTGADMLNVIMQQPEWFKALTSDIAQGTRSWTEGEVVIDALDFIKDNYDKVKDKLNMSFDQFKEQYDKVKGELKESYENWKQKYEEYKPW